MEDLDFNLVVFSPFRPLCMMIKDAGLQEWAQQAWAVLNDSYRTDVSLMTPPHIVAVASIYLATSLCHKDISAWMDKLNVDLDLVGCLGGWGFVGLTWTRWGV